MRKVAKIGRDIIIMICALCTLALMLWLFSDMYFERNNQQKNEVNIYLGETKDENERIQNIIKLTESDCSLKTKEFIRIEAEFIGYENIIFAKGDISYIFKEYIDHSAEGGNISSAEIKVKNETNIIYAINIFEGSGREYSWGGDKLHPEEWSMTVEDALHLFVEYYSIEKIELVENPRIFIKISNGISLGENIYILYSPENEKEQISRLYIDPKTGEIIKVD